MIAGLLSLLALVGAVVHLWSLRSGHKQAHYWSKPLTTLAIVGIAAFVIPGVDPVYRRWIVAGLLASLAGDVLLMLPSDRFIQGLLAFLVAHVFYLMAFAGRIAGWPGPALLAILPYVISSIFVLTLLWRHLGKLRVPVLFYTAIIGLMAATALAVASLTGGLSAWFAAIGAAIFVVSDAALAMDRFIGNLPRGRELVMSLYYAAQWLIAMSVMAG